jgi:hypothetical protein
MCVHRFQAGIRQGITNFRRNFGGGFIMLPVEILDVLKVRMQGSGPSSHAGGEGLMKEKGSQLPNMVL